LTLLIPPNSKLCWSHCPTKLQSSVDPLPPPKVKDLLMSPYPTKIQGSVDVYTPKNFKALLIRRPTKLPCSVDPLVPPNFKDLLTHLDPPNFKTLLIRCPTKLQSSVGQRGERVKLGTGPSEKIHPIELDMCHHKRLTSIERHTHLTWKTRTSNETRYRWEKWCSPLLVLVAYSRQSIDVENQRPDTRIFEEKNGNNRRLLSCYFSFVPVKPEMS
jgi:hypothetical protein